MLEAPSAQTDSRGSKRKPDFVDIALRYAREAVKDRRGKRYGLRIRQAARRYLEDLKRASKPRTAFHFDRGLANRYCEFIEELPHVKGTWERDTIKLAPAQAFLVVQIFGFRKRDGTRRFSTVLFAVARKNAKSTLAAAILVAVLCLEDELGPEILSAATTGDQARIVWNIAKQMVERTPDLRAQFDLAAFANAIARFENDGTFKPINAKASTQDGLNPSALAFDEIHAHKTRDLFDVLRSATGSRANPLYLYTTTEGYLNAGPWSELRHFAFQVLEGVINADHFLAVYYSLDEDDNTFDEKTWIKANPLLGVSVLPEKLRELAKEAKGQPGQIAEFEIKRCNRQAASAKGWLHLPKWRKCAGEVPFDKLKNVPATGGLDLASTTDMVAWRLVWELEDVVYTWGRYWVPESASSQRTERGSVAYSAWIATGLVTMTEGDIVDYDVITRDIIEDCGRFNVGEIAYDTWNAAAVATDLTNEGLQLVQFIQGPKSYHPAMQEAERLYMSGRVRHGGDAVLTWNMTNLVPRVDVNLNKAPDRRRSPDKIDGACAFFMALSRTMAARAAGTTQTHVVLG